MNNYEAVFMLNAKLEEAALTELKGNLQSVLTSVGGEGVTEISCDRRGLAFPIKKQTEAYYLIFRFTGQHDIVAKLRTELKHREEILRMSFLSLPDIAVKTPVTECTTPTAPTPEISPAAETPATEAEPSEPAPVEPTAPDAL